MAKGSRAPCSSPPRTARLPTRAHRRGVEFVEAPEERPYRYQRLIRDPSGNHIRLTEVPLVDVITAWA